jgi:hypothetical protein
MALFMQRFENLNLSRTSLALLLLISLSTAQCKKSPSSPENDFFDLEFWFVNQGDSDIIAIEIISMVYYPEIDTTRYRFRNFQRPGLFETIRDTADTNGYPGVITQMGLFIHKYWEVGDTLACWKAFYFPDKVTVDSPEQRITQFHWPADTTKSLQVYQNRVGFCQP